MDKSSIRHIRKTSNVDVTEAPTARDLVKQYVMQGMIGITVVTAFMIVSMGYNPFGCKTQFLFNTPKYWYNKQISIIILIYFAIVMGGKGTLLISPIAKFLLTIVIWMGFNVLLTLGGIWAIKHPQPWWPGPLDWFGLVILQMISLFIVNDTKKHYQAVAPSGGYKQAMTILGYLENLLIVTILGSTALGFYKVAFSSKRIKGSKFRIWRLLFGVPDEGGTFLGIGCKRYFAKFRKELHTTKGYAGWGPEALIYPFILILGTLGIVHLVTSKEAKPRIM